MKNTPLKELGWFSFASDLQDLKYLSIYQSIAYVLRKEDVLVLEVDEYKKQMHELEIASAEEIYEHYGETTDSYAASTEVSEMDYQEICIPESEITADLDLLNQNRISLVEHMGAPISMLYTLLQSEIDKSKIGSSLLDIQENKSGNIEWYSFNRKQIDTWKSVSTIKDLGLLDPKMLPRSDVRTDRAENQKKTMGMLIHMLANQPLQNNRGPVKFIKKADSQNINYHLLYEYFCDNYLPDADSDFPSENTVRRNLKEGYELFRQTTPLK
jgi:hypothetical protein